MERLSQKQAKKLARNWVDEQNNLPRKLYVEIRKYDQRIGGRLFAVIYDSVSIGITSILEFYVLDSGDVRIKRDRRERFKPLLEKEARARAIGRFLAVLAIRTPTTPKWFLGVEGSSLHFNFHGIGVFAHIDVGEQECLKVPMEIKNNWHERVNYNRGRPTYWIENVKVVIVNNSYTDEQIRQQTYCALGEARKKKIPHDELIRKLFRSE